jgi:hypothetical protein
MIHVEKQAYRIGSRRSAKTWAWERPTVFTVFILLCLVLATPTHGQNTTGSIVGEVTDSSGASVPNARVTILRVETGESRPVTTNGNGAFTAQLLNPGTYTVTVTADGFKHAIRNGIVLQVDRVARADFALEVGGESQTVTVNSQSLTLDTDSTQVGQTIVENQVTQLPMNGRNFTDLLFLTPGAGQTTGEQNQFRYDSGGAISLEGSRSGSNGYTIDGTSIMEYGYDTPAYNISLDAIQEFNVQTATYSAQYGYSANQVNISSKSGSNEFHGSAFEYIRNDAVDAKNFFLTTNQPLRQNQFGYSLGGPVWIPKIYDGRRKTFFFANYEGQRIHATQAVSGITPTAQEVQGIFPFPIYDPLTGLEFPGDTIPTSRVSRLGQVIQSDPTYWFPAPNIPGAAQGATNYVAGVAAPVTTDQQNYRIDQQFGAKDSAFFRAAKSDILAVSPNLLTSISDLNTIQAARNYTLTETHIFIPTLLNQFRVGYLEFQSVRSPTDAPASGVQALGLSNVFNIPDGGYPDLQFLTYSNSNRPQITNANQAYSQTGGANNAPTENLESLWDIEDSVSWTKGQHTLNFGMGLRRFIYQTNDVANPLGIFAYDGEFSGNAISDVLLGNPQKSIGYYAGPLGNLVSGPKPHLHFATYAPYVQDDWKATSRLTVNAGLRYEFNAVPYEESNTLGWFDPSLAGGGVYVASQAVVAAGGGYYAYNGQRGPGPAPKNDFAPRLGFAYRPFKDDRTVVRAGYGLFFDTSQDNEWADATGFYPFYVSSTQIASYGLNLIQTNNLFPALPAATVTPATMPFELVDTHMLNPYVQSWTFDIQRDIARNTIVDVNYAGNKGTHLMTRDMVNQPTQCIPSFGCNPDTTSPGYIPALSRSPYPNFGNPTIDDKWFGYSNYNALNAKVEHRGTDLTLLAAYTWSKSMDIKSSSAAINGDAAGWIAEQNAHDVSADYARSSYDVGQRLAVSFIGQLPVGRGQKFASSVNRAVDAAIGGWQVSGIGIFQGGFPFTINATDIGFVNWAYAERANEVGNPYPAGFTKDRTHWFNTSAFAQPAPGYFGDSQRNAVRAPGVEVVNLTAGKIFSLSDRVKLQLRVESFNALNHPQFAFPDAGVNDGPNFGVISSTAAANRENQGAIRITF